jgi:mono/diheme cytochrome c family protein
MKTQTVLTCGALLIAFTSAFAAAQSTASNGEDAAVRGEQTYMRVGCYQCHGSDGYGNEAGPALTPDTLPAVAIAAFIRTSPGRMPVYPEEVLSDAEIADIVAYLKSVPPPPSADSIEILRELKSGN